MNPVKNFFYPSSICAAGASTKEKSIGYELLKTIKNFGYTGNVFPVNPKAEEVLGYRCYKSIGEIKDTIDLAIVMVPKNFAETTIDELLEAGVKSIILITAGFKEIGKEGEEAENRILRKVKEKGARLVGPNCMGVINTHSSIKLNATFVAEKPETGSTGFFSQSGAIGAAVLNSLRETDIRFLHFLSAGNKADINENDLLTYWQNDDKIKTLTYYLESFINGEDFIKPFRTGEISKPVIVLKAGRTAGGIKAASSHTGALASNDKIVDAVLKQFGIIRAENLNELFNTAKGFENFPMPAGGRIAVVTNAGGPAILAVDALERSGLKLALLSEETKTKLKEIIHPEGSANNPVDLLPGGTAGQFKLVNEIVSADNSVDAVVSIFVEPVMVPALPVVEGINSINSSKPIFQVVLPLPEFWNEYRKNSEYKYPLFRTPEEPAAVIANMLSFNAAADNKNRLTAEQPRSAATGSGFLDQQQVYEICGKYGLPLNEVKILKKDGLLQADIEYPVVLKGVSKDVVHKTELDAVKLNIKNKEELTRAVNEIDAGFASGGFTAEGYLLQPFIKIKHELLIGGYRDPSFGPVIMFGTGGKYVEAMDDTSIRSAYLTNEDIDSMINETKIGKLLQGVRGEKPADIKKLGGIIKSAAQMMLNESSVTEFDFNPLLTSEEGKFHIVDARIKIKG